MANQPIHANLTQVYYKPEKSAGIEHIHAAWVPLRITGESLSAPKGVTPSRNLKRARSATGAAFTQDAPAGTINCLLTPEDLDEVLQSVMRNRWNAKQLNQGDVSRTYSILIRNTNPQGQHFYILYTGCVFTSVAFSFQVNSFASFAVNVIGTNVVNNYTPNSRVIFDTKSTNEPFIGRDGRISIDGTQVGMLSAFTGSFGHASEVIKRISFENPLKVRVGQFDAEATLTGAYNNESDVQHFVDETSFELSIALQYMQDRYTFILPNCVTSGVSRPSSGQGAVILTSTLVPLFSANRGSTVIIRKERI